MSKISFVYDDKNSVYVNSREDTDIVKTPVAAYSQNVLDWDGSAAVVFSEQEIATIDNQDSSACSLSKIIQVAQSEVGDVLFRAMVKAEDVPGSPGAGFELYADIRHTDDSWEYSKSTEFPTGKFPWSQFALTLHSDAGKTIKWVYPYMMMSGRIGKASFKFPEVIDLTDAGSVDVGEAYSKPECIYEPVSLSSPQGRLKLSLTPFVYGNLANINLKASPAHSISTLSQFSYLICGEPGTLSDREEYVTDAIKATVNIFGYVSMYASGVVDMAAMKAAVDRIAADDWYGVFLDCYGYDFEQTRARQNEIVDYAHTKGLKCFANGWNIDDVLGSIVDPTYNSDGTPTSLGQGDWALLESFLMSNSGYAAALEKYGKAKAYKESLGVSVGCLSYKRTATTWEQAADDAELSYLMALLYGFDGWWFVDAIENDAFLYRPDPGVNAGDTLLTEFDQISPYWYMAETDKYIFIFSAETYDPLTFTVYDKSRRCELPEDTTILYSDDFETWKEYDSKVPDLIGKFVREKLVIV